MHPAQRRRRRGGWRSLRHAVGGAELKHRGGSCSADDLFDEGHHCIPTRLQIAFEAGLSNDEVVDRLVDACAPPKTGEPRQPCRVNLALHGVNDLLVYLQLRLRLLLVERPLQGVRAEIGGVLVERQRLFGFFSPIDAADFLQAGHDVIDVTRVARIIVKEFPANS